MANERIGLVWLGLVWFGIIFGGWQAGDFNAVQCKASMLFDLFYS